MDNLLLALVTSWNDGYCSTADDGSAVEVAISALLQNRLFSTVDFDRNTSDLTELQRQLREVIDAKQKPVVAEEDELHGCEADITRIAEEYDRLGTLQGWIYIRGPIPSRRDHIFDFVFEHGTVRVTKPEGATRRRRYPDADTDTRLFVETDEPRMITRIDGT